MSEIHKLKHQNWPQSQPRLALEMAHFSGGVALGLEVLPSSAIFSEMRGRKVAFSLPGAGKLQALKSNFVQFPC